MQLLGLVWGIAAVIGAVVAFFPCLGSLNWLNIPFSIIGLVISVIGLAKAAPEDRGTGIAAVACCGIAIAIGIIRLVMGAGIL